MADQPVMPPANGQDSQEAEAVDQQQHAGVLAQRRQPGRQPQGEEAQGVAAAEALALRRVAPQPDELEDARAAQEDDQRVVGDRGVEKVELGQEGHQRRGHQRPGVGFRPEQAAALVDAQQRAQAEQRGEDAQDVGGQRPATPRPGFGRGVDHAVDVGQGRGVADPGVGVEPDRIARAVGLEGRDERCAKQVVERWLGGFLPQPLVGRVGDDREAAGFGDLDGGEEVPMLVGRLEERVGGAVGQGDEQIAQQNRSQ